MGRTVDVTGDLTGDVVGTVARLQVQRSRLKPGARGAKAYDPAPLLEVAELEVGPRGAVGLVAGERVVDVHHADHPDSRWRGGNGLSLLPRAHAEALRQRYGDHLDGGRAGESLLLDTAGPLREADLVGDLLLETVDGPPLRLSGAQAAPPCVEFSRWVLGREAGALDDEVLAALAALGCGARGFYVDVHGTGRVRAGARLLRSA